MYWIWVGPRISISLRASGDASGGREIVQWLQIHLCVGCGHLAAPSYRGSRGSPSMMMKLTETHYEIFLEAHGDQAM